MFFSTYVLTRRGPLAKVWLAAHWDKRLTRHDVKVVDLTQTIVYIVHPVVPIALRTSGELLMGVVRIYALKVKHLLREATEAATMLLLRVSVTTVAKSGGGGGSVALLSSGHKRAATRAGVARTAGDDANDDAAAGGAAYAHGSEHYTSAATAHGSADRNAIALAYTTGAMTTTPHAAASWARDRVAEALGEVHYRAVADLVDDVVTHSNDAAAARDADALQTSWFTVQASAAPYADADDKSNSQRRHDDNDNNADGSDAVAQMRADLAALGARARSASNASSSNNSNKSKASLPSIEHGRGSAVDAHARLSMAMAAGGDDAMAGVPYPAVFDDMDMGVALPDELPHSLHALVDGDAQQQLHTHDGALTDDFFAIPDLHMTVTTTAATATAAAAAAAARARKLRAVTLYDLASTTLSRSDVERAMHERGDTLSRAPRHGPHDDADARDRDCLARACNPHDAAASRTLATRQSLYHVTAANNSNNNNDATSTTTTTTATLAAELERLAEVAPLSSHVVSPLLRDGFAAALQASMTRALHDVVRVAAASRAQQQQQQQQARRARPLVGAGDALAVEDAAAAVADDDMTAMMMGGGGAHALLPPLYGDDDTAPRKRHRSVSRSSSRSSSDDSTRSAVAAASLSASAAHTLERLRHVLLAAAGDDDNDDDAAQRKRARADDSNDGDADAQQRATRTHVTTLRVLCDGLRRRAAARTFVDVLALASQHVVDARASRSGDEVLLSLRDRVASTTATAAAA